jgi:hypothetical protein
MNIIKAFWCALYGDNEDCDPTETIVLYFEEQKGLYDCGLCCVKMALKWYNLNGFGEFNVNKLINEHEISTFTTPLWTIDLYCFLRSNNINCIMYTTSVGVNPALYDIDWYNRHINVDLKRVQDKFALAEHNQWIIKTHSISISEIIKKFIDNNKIIAIILVDSNILNLAGYSATPATYSGHFIILSAYKPETNKFEYVNPSSSKPFYKYINVEKLDRARKATGTDEDLIFINTSD